jgi:hypothetical protein
MHARTAIASSWLQHQFTRSEQSVWQQGQVLCRLLQWCLLLQVVCAVLPWVQRPTLIIKMMVRRCAYSELSCSHWQGRVPPSLAPTDWQQRHSYVDVCACRSIPFVIHTCTYMMWLGGTCCSTPTGLCRQHVLQRNSTKSACMCQFSICVPQGLAQERLLWMEGACAHHACCSAEASAAPLL